jgi:hypothetical protein
MVRKKRLREELQKKIKDMRLSHGRDGIDLQVMRELYSAAQRRYQIARRLPTEGRRWFCTLPAH